MPAPTFSTLCLAVELAAFEARGLDVAAILEHAGVTRALVTDPRGRIPIEARLRWWEAALRVSGDPALGLHVGAALPIGALGSFEYLLRHSTSLAEIIDRANEFIRLIDETGRLELGRHGERASLRLLRSGGFPLAPAEVHVLFAACVATMRTEWPSARLLAVRFAHEAPPDPAIFVRHFACPVEFGSDAHVLEFDASLIAARPRHADPMLGRVLEDHTRNLLAALPPTDPFLAAAKAELRALVDRGTPTLGALARALHVSERTLRRRLASEGTSYHALLDDIRAALARDLVGRTRDGFDAIAARLAFADTSTFFHAFKRWTGDTPARFRKRIAG